MRPKALHNRKGNGIALLKRDGLSESYTFLPVAKKPIEDEKSDIGDHGRHRTIPGPHTRQILNIKVYRTVYGNKNYKKSRDMISYSF